MVARWWAVVVLVALPSLGAGGDTPEAPPESWTQLWFFRFLMNAAGYASFMVPGYLLVQYFKRRNYLETGRGLCFPLVKACVFGNEPKASDEVPLASRTEPAETTPTWQALKLLFCAVGLQASYLTWGVLQERVMTRSYGATATWAVGSLLEQGALLEGTRFMGRHSEFAAHALLLSICSACGQLFIFYTIGQFGAAVFTIIMTLRQAFAILLSCLLYGHTITVVGGLGVAVVFAALLLRVYARGRLKQRGKKAVPIESPVQKV